MHEVFYTLSFGHDSSVESCSKFRCMRVTPEYLNQKSERTKVTHLYIRIDRLWPCQVMTTLPLESLCSSSILSSPFEICLKNVSNVSQKTEFKSFLPKKITTQLDHASKSYASFQ